MTQSILQAVVVGQTTPPANVSQVKIALLNPDGTPYTVAAAPMTGYVAVTAGPVLAADSIRAAIAKLEARIVELETP